MNAHDRQHRANDAHLRRDVETRVQMQTSAIDLGAAVIARAIETAASAVETVAGAIASGRRCAPIGR